MRHRNDRAGQGQVLRIGEDVSDEAAIDLDAIHARTPQVTESGKAGTEVVQPYAHANSAQLTERGEGAEFCLAESGAILRHLARRFDMYGSGLSQHAMADSLADFVAESRSKYVPIAYAATFHTSPEAIAKFYEHLPQTLAILERAHGRSQSPAAGWFIGDAVTFADVTAFDYLDGIERRIRPPILNPVSYTHLTLPTSDLV